MHHHQGGNGMQEVIQMCSSFDAAKSTKGASKLRRDLINAEIANLRDLLPLPSSTRQRLSQLQLMALVCVYVRKANYFQQVLKRYHEMGHPYSTPSIGFSKALSGFIIMMTQNGKLLYISDNAAEYLGHSMEDLLIHGDSVYDIIDKADHGTVQAELLRNSSPQNPPGEESRLFLCRMNVSRNARRQMRFGDQKVVLLQGRYLSYLPLCSRNEPVFVGSCTPVAMPETRECVVQGATNVFTTIHAMDMKFMHVDRNGEYYLGYSRSELGGISWYQLIHWNYMREAQSKHRLISQSEQEKSCILLLRLQTRGGDWLWVHCVLQVKDGTESSSNSQQQPTQSVIVATNQVLSEREAGVMRANSWLYHYYTVQTKLQYGLAYPEVGGTQGSPTAAAAAARLAAAAYFPSPQLINYSSHPHLHHTHHPHHHHQLTSEGFSGYSSSSASSALQPSGVAASALHSPHNGGAYTPSPYHHPHHHHPLPHPHNPYAAAAAAFEGGKESPLDFSIAAAAAAASSASIPFEFHQMSANPYAQSYWSHHQHHHASTASLNHHHSSSSSANNHLGSSNSTSSSHHHGYSSSSGPNGSSGHHKSSSEGTTVSPSATSPQNWSLSTQPVATAKGTSTNGSSNSGTSLSTSSSSSSSSPRKKMKKSPSSISSGPAAVGAAAAVSSSISHSSHSHSTNSSTGGVVGEMLQESSSPPLSSSGHLETSRISSSAYNLGHHPHHHYSQEGSSSAVSALIAAAAASPFPYHTRPRGVYKIFGGMEDSDSLSSPVKEEALAMACPLTPSPIWEGQTQRVPDLQLYGSHHHHHNHHGGVSVGGSGNGGSVIGSTSGLSHGSSNNSNGERDSHGNVVSGTDLIHCVPTYQPYLPFCPTSNGTSPSGMHPNNHHHPPVYPPGLGFAMGLAAASGHQGFHMQMSDSGSPNKENRLPPTPESDTGENEENKPIKWESL